MTSVSLGVFASFLAVAPGASIYGYYDENDYDDGSLYAPDITYQDISDRLRGEVQFSSSRGARTASDTFFRVEAGSAQIRLDNRDRALDPEFTTGPYTIAGETKVVPGVPVQFTATIDVGTIDETTYTLFTGTADGWPPNYAAGTDQTVDLEVSDAVAEFANTQFTAVRPVETSGERIDGLLTKANWPRAFRDVASGLTNLNTLEDSTVTAWSTMLDIAEAERGALYVDADGIVHFDDRNTILVASRSAVSQATFGNEGSELRYADVGITYDRDLILNDAELVYNDQGDSVGAADTVSQFKPWRVQSWSRALPLHDLAYAKAYAQLIVTQYAYPRIRFSELVLEPNDDRTDLWPQALGREIGDRITVRATPLGGGPRIERDCWIRGISHVGIGEYWRTTFVLEDATWSANIGYYDQNDYDDGSVYGL